MKLYIIVLNKRTIYFSKIIKRYIKPKKYINNLETIENIKNFKYFIYIIIAIEYYISSVIKTLNNYIY